MSLSDDDDELDYAKPFDNKVWLENGRYYTKDVFMKRKQISFRLIPKKYQSLMKLPERYGGRTIDYETQAQTEINAQIRAKLQKTLTESKNMK